MALFDVAGRDFELVPRDTGGTADGAAGGAARRSPKARSSSSGRCSPPRSTAVTPVARAANVTVDRLLDRRDAGRRQCLSAWASCRASRSSAMSPTRRRRACNRFAALAPAIALRPGRRDAALQATAAARPAQPSSRSSSTIRGAGCQPGGQAHGRAGAVRRRRSTRCCLPEGGSALQTAGAAHAPTTASTRRGAAPRHRPVGRSRRSAASRRWSAAGLPPRPGPRATSSSATAPSIGTAPPRLASLGLRRRRRWRPCSARQPAGADFDDAALTDPNGFSGIDGIFRFRPNGTGRARPRRPGSAATASIDVRRAGADRPSTSDLLSRPSRPAARRAPR